MRRRAAVVLALAAWLAAAAFAHAAPEPFRDGGDPASLLRAARLARSGLSGESPARRRLLEAMVAGLREGGPVEAILAAHARAGAPSSVLLTGYYEPTLAARRHRGGGFRYPVYAVPGEPALRGLSRRAIDAGALAGRGLELFWLQDPIEVFFLHVQGSGRLELERGARARVGYAGDNGHAYHSIGKELVSRGVLAASQATAPAIKRWLRRHPERTSEILQTNPRFIFFREIEAPPGVGPPGALGVPLVAFRSVAADPEVVAPGTVGLLTATLPDGTSLRRVVVAMDAGAAIRGPARLDLFLGAGRRAELLAGELRARSRVVWLKPR